MKCASRFLGCTLLVACIPTQAQAERVRHLFDYSTSPLAIQTNGACGALTVSSDSLRCNPALLRATGKNMGFMELTTLAQESTFRALWKFATEPLSGADVARLFSQHSFASYSGFARFATTTPWFALEYIPASLSGAYRISNPSLPFIQVAGIHKQAFSLNTAIGSNDLGLELPANIFVGTKIKYSNTTTAKIEIDAISALAVGGREIVQKKRRDTFDADIGIAVLAPSPWLPKLGVVCAQCASSAAKPTEPSSLDVSQTETRATALHAAWEASPGLGVIWGSLAAFWDGIFETYEWERNSLALGYRIGELNISGAVSPAKTVWGFLMQRGYYQLGMQYASEKQPALFQTEWQEKLYLSVGAAL